MKLSAFRFHIPDDLLSRYPAKHRDESRLMVLHRKTKKIEHRIFKNVVEYFSEGDVMIINDTRVFPARLYGNKEKTGARIEVFLLRELSKEQKLWDVLVDPARKIRVGNKLFFGNSNLVAEIVDNTTSRGRTIRFLYDGTPEELNHAIESLGQTPLPKYMKREPDANDKERYQTIYAKNTGAVAAPTAGLHFTREVMKRLEIKGVHFTPITLHIGLGTFRKVEVEDLTKHKMDSESFEVKQSACDVVNQALDDKKRICMVGTSSMRAAETAVGANRRLKPLSGWTEKFIFPPYDFAISSAMITNFHLPESTLLMMASAFGGFEFVKEAYEVAVKEKYKFFTYGDCMLIL
ncbi:MAG: tRNA preQ1(34) S-adenosylmethionine ribosyltransferase-isomerase QueA [Bacteroidetes bacterium RIFCSPLOWO2_12_FULL_37_12]|nr:MAG: tRNA preQ1(34) S-adenosylmethionine ribosyltransferase-isomerase QueA [Bacteroidetes bacterium RIFCSPLOWO2_12_FULL_37_12]